MLLLLSLMACAPELLGPAAWAVNEASLTPSSTGLQGVQVWTLYADGWERRQTDDYLQCTLVQDVEGSVMAAVDGCLRCAGMYEVRLREVDSDCEDSVLEGVDLSGLQAIGVGEPSPELEEDNPRPDIALGWYLSFDREQAEAHGWAWPEDGEAAAGDGWRSGVTYTFEPGYAWNLQAE
ncbi:MAG: hypothetical protein H6741_09530 [Alphaproteobacteria bacterium]|nr:hypothetical protein [Alphaproteobacteria bacterium]